MTESKTQRLAHISTRLNSQNLSRASSIVHGALGLMNPDLPTSAPGQLHAHTEKTRVIRADRDLSAHGQQSKIRASADSCLGNVGTMARKLMALEQEHRTAAANAVPLPRPTDPWEIACDFEVARLIREKPLSAFHLTTVGVGEIDARVREAIARVPAALTGLKEEQRALIQGSLVAPQLAVQLSEERQALDAARQIIQSAIDELAPEAGWSAREFVDHIGPGWNLPGVTQSRADRMAAGGSENVWSADSDQAAGGGENAA